MDQIAVKSVLVLFHVKRGGVHLVVLLGGVQNALLAIVIEQ